MHGINKLGETKEMQCFYSIPEPISDSLKAERKAEQRREFADRNFFSVKKQCLDLISQEPGIKVGEIKARMSKRSETVGAALETLVDSGHVRLEENGKAKRYFPATPSEGAH
jgi:predicted HTH transcriptional regulator